MLVLWDRLPPVPLSMHSLPLIRSTCQVKSKKGRFTSHPIGRHLLSHSFRFLGGELKATADETLFLELALRGYDLSKLRDNPTTAEIIKIG